MPRWKKDATAFSVKVTFDGKNSMVCRIPKPILEALGNPDKLKFLIQKNSINIIADDVTNSE